MLREMVLPVLAIACAAVAAVCCLDKFIAFYQTHQRLTSRLESERWLLRQCSDPVFFSNMHTHTDLCLEVANNARVGAFMLALREHTQHFLHHHPLSGLVLTSTSWPALGAGAVLLMLLPSGLFGGSRTLQRRWATCRDPRLKYA